MKRSASKISKANLGASKSLARYNNPAAKASIKILKREVPIGKAVDTRDLHTKNPMKNSTVYERKVITAPAPVPNFGIKIKDKAI